MVPGHAQPLRIGKPECYQQFLHWCAVQLAGSAPCVTSDMAGKTNIFDFQDASRRGLPGMSRH